MNRWASLGILAAVAIGTLLPLQALINARLGAQTQGPLYASFVSFRVGTCLLGAMLLATRTPLSPGQPIAALPAWIEGRTESITVLLDDATHGIAPGQAVVCYDGDRVVGSATIAATAR